MKYPLIVLLNLILLSCSESSLRGSKSNVQIQIFGDTLKIETEIKGDYTIKRHIDLKGSSDDGFDSSFEVYLKYEIRPIIPILAPFFNLQIDNYCIRFNKETVLDFCTRKVEFFKEQGDFSWVEKVEDFRQIVDGTNVLESIHPIYQDYWSAELLTNCDYYLESTKMPDKVDNILIEFYETSFSGGKIFYILTKSDTTRFFEVNDWMR